MPDDARTPGLRGADAARPCSGRSSRWLALLLVNIVVATAASSTSGCQDGHLYGSLVDILREQRAALLVALGMTLVIATRGIDLSVGAVVGDLRRGHPARTSPARPTRTRRHACVVGDAASPSAAARARAVERLPRRRARHPADHRDAGADDGRARHRPADHRRADHHRRQRTLFTSCRRRLPARPAGRVPHRAGACSRPSPWSTRRTALGMLIEAVGDQPRGEPAGRRPVPRGIIFTVYVVLRALRRHRRPDDQLEHHGRRREQRRPVDRARRDPRRRDRRHARCRAAGSPSPARWSAP